MKSLRGIVFGFIAMVAMIGGVSAVDFNGGDTCNSDSNTAALVKANGSGDCYDSINTAISNAEAGDTVKILKDGITFSGVDLTVAADKDITLDLSGYTLTFDAKTVNVSGKVVVTNGTLVGSSSNTTLVTVNAGGSFETTGTVVLEEKSTTGVAIKVVGTDGKDTNVTIGSETTVKSEKYGLVVDGTTAPGVTVNVAGTWDAKQYAVKVNGTVGYNAKAPVVNVNAGTYTAENTVLYASGYGIWNVNAGTFTGASAMQVNSGKVTINGGTFVGTEKNTSKAGHAASNGSALNIINGAVVGTGYPTADKIDLAINGGSFISESTNAVYIDQARDGKIVITDGYFESADELPAIAFNDVMLDKYAGMIINGTFANSIVGPVNRGSYTTSATNAAKILIGDAATTEDENGNIIVGNPSTSDENSTGAAAGTTDSGEANPNTADVNLMTLVGTILVGLAGLAYTAKRRLFN